MEASIQRRIQRYGWDKAVRYYEQYWGQQLAPAQTTPARDGRHTAGRMGGRRGVWDRASHHACRGVRWS